MVLTRRNLRPIFHIVIPGLHDKVVEGLVRVKPICFLLLDHAHLERGARHVLDPVRCRKGLLVVRDRRDNYWVSVHALEHDCLPSMVQNRRSHLSE